MTESDKGGRATHPKATAGATPAPKSRSKPQGELPGWTNGLRRLYDEVVEEDLPDSFRDLLARLDDPS